MGTREGWVASLTGRHNKLEAEIARIQGGPAPDSLALTRAKKRKLAIKDEIAQLN